MTVSPKQLTLIPRNSATKTLGLFSAALNVACTSSGDSSHAEGGTSLAGQSPVAFTIPAGGTLVTVAGDQTAQFNLSETVRILPSAPKSLPVSSGVVNSAPVFAAGNTTFNLAAPINTTTTGGTIVLSSSAAFGRGRCAHAEGYITTAQGVTSHAEGYGSEAYGAAGHAEGAYTLSIGHGAHSEGEVAVAGGTDSHAEGIGTLALGFGCHAEGLGTPTKWLAGNNVAGGDGSHVEGENNRAGNTFHPFTIPAGGTLVTIPGNVVAEFNIGDTRIPFMDTVPQKGPILYGEIADQPVFAAGNTTFNLTKSLGLIGPLDTPGVGYIVTGGYTCGTQMGRGAHAEGGGTIASANGSHAEGEITKAYAKRSHAEGKSSIASDLQSHAEGESTVASGINSHAEGYQTLANSNTSNASGRQSRTGLLKQTFSIVAGGILVTIAGNVTAQFTNGTDVAIDPITPTTTTFRVHRTVSSVPAFAAGNTTFNLNAAIDAFTTDGFILSPTVGDAAHAEGYQTIASQNYAHAEGQSTIASGIGSHSEGGATTASGLYAHAEGISNTASGADAHAEGNGCVASGADSHAEGFQTTASAAGCHAEGALTIASAFYSHAQGWSCQAVGSSSSASGRDAKASNENEDCFAGTAFSAVGDAQFRRIVIKGVTPGAGAGETVILKSGTSTAVFMIASKSYMVKLRGIATKMGLGAGARQSFAFEYDFVVDCNSANALTISALTPVIAIVTGAAFVGATVTVVSSGAGQLAVTFTIAGGLTIQSRIVGFIELVEVLGT